MRSGDTIGPILFLAISFISLNCGYCQTVSTKVNQERKIVRKLPLSDGVKKALRNGTRQMDGAPGPNYWQLETDFEIDVRVEPETGTLLGSETITLHNNSPDDLNEIVIRLDHNIFRKECPRGSAVPAEFTQGMVVEKITVDGRDIQLKTPSDKTERDFASNLTSTSATIHLSKPIGAKTKSEIDIQWKTKLPGGQRGRGHRMTQRWGKRLFQPTQWFPRIAKYDDLRGWDRNQYRGPAEFYNNFGKFNVKIDVPAGWIVSATGTLQNPKEVLTDEVIERLNSVLKSDQSTMIIGPNESGPGKGVKAGDRLVWHFQAEKVNDFAWSTANNYIWSASKANIPGKGPIPIHMYYTPRRAHLFQNAAAISKHALEFYSKLWEPYPFPKLALQDGPSAGMEYPMVINSNQGAADHEVAHQWWPMMLGTNETDFGWMDEGLNVYMNSLSRADTRGKVGNLNGRGQSYRGAGPNVPTLMSSSNQAGGWYGFLAYQKTTHMMSMLGGIVGDEEVKRAVKEYTKKWKFKHPSPWDFANSMNKSLKKDLNWFWYYWLFTNSRVDMGIKNWKILNGQLSMSISQEGAMPAPIVARIYFNGVPKNVPEAKNVKVLGDGSIVATWPVEDWFDGKKSRTVNVNVGLNSIRKIVLDPYGRFPDAKRGDNVVEIRRN